jgi:hypothetical protein
MALFGLIKPKLSKEDKARLDAMSVDQLNAELSNQEEHKKNPKLTTGETAINVALMPLSFGTMFGAPLGYKWAANANVKSATKKHLKDLPTSEKVLQQIIEQPVQNGVRALEMDGIKNAFKNPDASLQEGAEKFIEGLKTSHFRSGVTGAVVAGAVFAVPELMLCINSDKKDHALIAEQKMSHINRLLQERQTKATPQQESTRA